jgi:hypothetical protein
LSVHTHLFRGTRRTKNTKPAVRRGTSRYSCCISRQMVVKVPSLSRAALCSRYRLHTSSCSPVASFSIPPDDRRVDSIPQLVYIFAPTYTMPRRPRCAAAGCSKRLTLIDTSLQCTCGLVFCATHRLPESHACTYDYKQTKIVLVGVKAVKVPSV